MKKVILLLSVLMVSGTVASGQSLLERLGNRAKNAVENNLGNKVEKGVNDVLNGKRDKKEKKADKAADATVAAAGWTCPECGAEGNAGKFCNECGAKKPSATAADASWTCPECGKTGNTGKFCEECGAKQSNVANATTEAVKSDFVRGSVILFEDDFANEPLGEFPSKWDVNEGSVETASINGKKYLNFTGDWNSVAPLMTNMESYLPDVFTLEWDVFYSKEGDYGQGSLDVQFIKKGSWNDQAGNIELIYRPWGPDAYGGYRFEKGEGSTGDVNGSLEWDQIKDYIKIGQWNHFAVSFNKRAFKFYINGNRVINLPNAKAPERILFIYVGDYRYRGFTNVVLAAGAKDLYERQTTDLSEAAKAVEKAITETGKFVTNNILFDTGKATIKPESIPEIQKVAEYMKSNPAARFEVQGHTDNQGSDKINDPLSQQRAEAVVKALEEQGVDPFNLRPVGKGSHEPVADNKTEDGRAKNRRVEFVKK